MPSSGSGTMHPISGGLPAGGVQVATPIPYTLLSLQRYARMMGIAPAHFMRGMAVDLDPQVFPSSASCSTLWPRYSWQNKDQVSHEDLAYTILSVEEEIAKLIGYFPAPMWLSETVRYDHHFNPNVYGDGYNTRGLLKTLHTEYGRVISGGRRAVTLIETASVAGGSLAYTDEDGDGLYETATITVATSLTNPCEIKLYYPGNDGAQEWEIRPVRSKAIAGGFCTIILDAWLLIKLELLAAFPTSDGFGAINISTTANYMTTVEVYREYNDFSQASMTMIFEPGGCSLCGGTGCVACDRPTQSGCLYVRDGKNGIVAPTPASYSATTGDWTQVSTENCIEPEEVQIWYYAGDTGQRQRRGVECDPLSDFWAQAIAWAATARLERPLCNCGNVQTVAEHLAEDLTLSQSNYSHGYIKDAHDSPLGPRRGEVMAWKRIARMVERRSRVAVI